MNNFTVGVGNKSEAYAAEATATERTHVEELQRATSDVRSLVDNFQRLHDSISGSTRPPESDNVKLSHTPCLLDQLIQTPLEIKQVCEEGFKTLETLRGYLRLR